MSKPSKDDQSRLRDEERLVFEQTSKEIFDYGEEPAASQARTAKDTLIRWSVRLVCGELAKYSY